MIKKDKFERMVDASPFTLWELIKYVVEAYSHLVPLGSEMTGAVLSRKIRDAYASPVSAFYAEVAERHMGSVKRMRGRVIYTAKVKEGAV